LELSYYLAYATEEKVVGLLKIPIDGNPYKSMGMIAHPKQITDIAVSGDSRFLFTAGGEDLCVNMWEIDTNYVERNIMLGGEEPFIQLLDGGLEGQMYADMKDFFYFSQIRSQGENVTK